MQEIPGYYFDPAKNRYFKIMPSGPHSLAAIRKAQEEAERSKAKANITKVQRFKPLPSPSAIRDQSVYQYIRSRRLCNKLSLTAIHSSSSTTTKSAAETRLLSTSSSSSSSPPTVVISGTRALYKRLKPVAKLNIPGSPLSRACCMDFRDGDAVICYPQGCPMRFKYQCDPFFTMWNTHFPAHVSADVTSLHLGERLLEYNDALRRPVYGTTEMSANHNKAQLWRLSMPPLADMDHELAVFLREHQQSRHRDTRTARTAPIVAVGNPPQQPDDAVTMDCTFSLRRNNFWTCSVDDDNHSLVVGCDTGAFMLTSTFNIIGRATARTAVLASSCIPDRPGVAWLGCRDSEVKMFDPRVHSQHNLRFKHSTLAIAHLKALDSYRVLAVDIGDSLAIWDMRFMANNKRNRPIRRLKGHVNTAGTRVACDVDQTKQLLALAGTDHCVRLWSLNDSLCSSTVNNSNQNLPFWESQKFGDGPVQAVQFIDNPPPMASAWKQLPTMSDDRENRAPGLVVAAPADGSSSSSSSSSAASSGIHWLTL